MDNLARDIEAELKKTKEELKKNKADLRELQLELMEANCRYLRLCNQTGVDKYKAECDLTVDKVKRQCEKLQMRNDALTAKIAELKKENSQLQRELAKDDKIREKHENLLQQLEKIKAQNKELNVEREQSKQTIFDLTQQVEALKARAESAEAALRKEKIKANHDSTNSSKSSSTDDKNKPKKKIQNSREKTDKKPGAQLGHEHHGRVLLDPTEENIVLDPPKEVQEDTEGRYVLSGQPHVHQKVDFEIKLRVVNYVSNVYVDTKTGKTTYAAFPPGLQNEVNYGECIRTIAAMLPNYFNVSVRKTAELLAWMGEDRIHPSTGFIYNNNRELAEALYPFIAQTFNELLNTDYMNTDATYITLNGKQCYVFVCASHGSVLYFFRETKGHDGIKGTPVEHTHAVLIHDHDTVFYSYGSDHQECLAHLLRYLEDSIVNEPNMEWNKKMKSFIQNLIHEAKENDRNFTDERIAELQKNYDMLLIKAREEYAKKGIDPCYRDGYNLFSRLDAYGQETLLFVKDPNVPWTNNESERLLRVIKRHAKQVTTFRAAEGIITYCNIIGYIMTSRNKGLNPFDEIAKVYGPLFALPTNGMSNKEFYKREQEMRKAEKEAREHAEAEQKKIEEDKEAQKQLKKERAKRLKEAQKARKKARDEQKRISIEEAAKDAEQASEVA